MAAAVANIADYRNVPMVDELTMSRAVELLEEKDAPEGFSVAYGEDIEVQIHKDDVMVDKEIMARRAYFLLQGLRTVMRADPDLAVAVNEALLNSEIALGTVDACTLWKEEDYFIMRSTSNRQDNSISVDIKISNVL